MVCSMQRCMAGTLAYRDVLEANTFGQQDMSGQLALDNHQAAVFDRHAPYTGIMDHKVPHMVSDHPAFPGPLISTINNRLEITDELCKPVE